MTGVLVGGKNRKDVLDAYKRALDERIPVENDAPFVEPLNSYVRFNDLAIELGDIAELGPLQGTMMRFDFSLERIAKQKFERHLLPREAMAVAIHYLEHPDIKYDSLKREHENHPLARLYHNMFERGNEEYVDVILTRRDDRFSVFYDHPRGIITQTHRTRGAAYDFKGFSFPTKPVRRTVSITTQGVTYNSFSSLEQLENQESGLIAHLYGKEFKDLPEAIRKEGGVFFEEWQEERPTYPYFFLTLGGKNGKYTFTATQRSSAVSRGCKELSPPGEVK